MTENHCVGGSIPSLGTTNRCNMSNNVELQKLLDEEARLANIAYQNNTTVDLNSIHNKIKELRGTTPMPCWKDDDCSTEFLMRCPWRIDCG